MSTSAAPHLTSARLRIGATVRRRAGRARQTVLLLTAALLVLAGCSTASSAKPVVLIYGDSLTVISESQAQFLLGGQYTLVFRAAGGTALCDWVSESPWDKARFHPAKVVIAFTGNDLSRCAAHAYAAGGETALVANYGNALQLMHAVFAGTPMSVLAAPASRPASPGRPAPINGDVRLDHKYHELCIRLGMHYDTRADDTLTPGHRFAWKRPAFPGNGPLVTVRRSDGVHVTPAGALFYAAAFAA
jgi:hypothetical protein